MLNALAAFLPPNDRVVLIDDTAELQIDRPNLVRFEARREQGGLSAVTIRELLRATLRHRPDRLIVGEVLGALSDAAGPSTSLGCGLRKRALIRWLFDTCE